MHRFGSYLNSHVHFHVLVTDGVFSAGEDGEAVFHPALDLEPRDFAAVQAKMRHRGLRWPHRHGHLDDDALHVLDSSDHADGRTELQLTPIERLDRLAQLVTPPRLHKHRTSAAPRPAAAGADLRMPSSQVPEVR